MEQEILVSSLLKELTESADEFAFGGGRAVSLKGISGKHRVFQVAWSFDSPSAAAPGGSG